MKEWNTAYPIVSRDDWIERPCGHHVRIPNEAFADKVEVPCLDARKPPGTVAGCSKVKAWLEVIDMQGILYVKWYVEGDQRAENLATAITVLIEAHGLSAVYAEVRKRDGFCGNCGTPLEFGKPHLMGGFGHCITDMPAQSSTSVSEGGENNG